MGSNTSRLVLGLDVGSSKTCAVIAAMHAKGELQILGSASVPSKGIRKGLVVNIEDTARVIATAVEQAQLQAGQEVSHAYIGISGGHIESINSHGVVAMSDRNKEIDSSDVRRVIEASTALIMPIDREVVHILPQSFMVDSQANILDPIGMTGMRLEATVHIITVAATSVNNFIKSVNKAHLQVQDMVLQTLAASQSCLTEEEKNLGVVLIDMGGGTTNYLVFHEGSLKRTGTFPVGGGHITNDIAFGLKTQSPNAESIKIKYGTAWTMDTNPDEMFEVAGLGGRPARMETRALLAEIIESRIEEMLLLVDQELQNMGVKGHLGAGAVLTGGVSKTACIVELAGDVLDMPTRVGYPIGVEGLGDLVQSPEYATAVGLAIYAQTHAAANATPADQTRSWLQRLGDWFNEWF